MSTTITPSERHMNLVLALIDSRHGLTRAQIMSQVVGYDPAASQTALERMFERDKKMLRELGLEVLTLNTDGPADDVRYRIERTGTEQQTPELSSAELTALHLVSALWQGTPLAKDSASAIQKLRGSVNPAHGDFAGQIDLNIQLQPIQEILVPLSSAIEQRQVISFTYRSASGDGIPQVRTVEPWRLYFHDGGRYLVGSDTDRQAKRTFKLNRIPGQITLISPPHAYDVPTNLDDSPVPTTMTRVVLGVAPHRAHHIRRRGTPHETALPSGVLENWDILDVTFDSEWEALNTVLSAGADVVVLEPQRLRDRVIRGLQHLVSTAGER